MSSRGRGSEGAAGSAPGVRTAVLSTLLAVFVAGCGGDAPEGGDAPGLAAFPPPSPAPVSPVSSEDFLGAEACAECHADEYRAWAGSTHGQAGGRPGPEVVIAPFDGTPVTFADATVIPRIRQGVYEFVVRQEHFEERVFRVDGVIGKGHMIGGGTQGFISRMDDGTQRFLPWDWSRHEGLWFCNTGSRLDEGWVPITGEMRLADCGDWPPLRPIGTVDRFANCQECHGSQILTAFDTTAHAYDTEYTSLRVNCESCHGPGRLHVEMARAGDFGADGDIGLESLAWRDKDASLETCFRCHALKDVVREGYLPGAGLQEFYALKFPTLGDRPYFADGRVRTFAYQANHLASACYLQGPMDCVSCHEPHGQGYWDTNKEPLDSPFDDGQCTSCHPSKAVRPEEHTFHPPESEGSRCVSCHMPYLQHPEVGPEVAFARSDHTIAVPRPVFDSDLGLTGACAQCHQDRSALELQSQARAWWGELKPHRPLIQGQVDELRARNPTEAAGLLLLPDETDPLVQFQALSRLFTAYLEPDVPELPDAIRRPLVALASNPDLDVRALALASLHWSAGEDPDVRDLLVRALETAENDRALRGRWALALGFLGDSYRADGAWERSLAAYRKALELKPGDPEILGAVGLMYNQAGDYANSVPVLNRSLEADPVQPLTLVNLGIALAARGNRSGARQAYQRAIELNPHEAVAHFNLGNLNRLSEDLPAAEEAYRRAVEADPGLGRAWFELGRTLILQGRPEEALPAARRAVEFMPEHPGSRQMLRDLESRVGG